MKYLAKSLTAIAIIAICAVLLYFGYTFFNKKPTQTEIDTTKTTIVTRLVAIGNLETTRMHMQKVVEGKQGLEDLLPANDWDNTLQEFLFGDSMQLVAYAEVVAGFDISNLNTGSIIVDGENIVSLILPEPKILNSHLTSETKPFVRKTGIFAGQNTQMETEIRNKTLEIMTQEAIDKGILDEAIKNAKGALLPLFSSMGYTINEITIQPTQNTP